MVTRRLCHMWETIRSILPDYTLLRMDESGPDPESFYYVCSGYAAVKLAAADIIPEHIYAASENLSDDDIRDMIGKCRFVANGLEELRRIHHIASEKNQGERLASVGLRLIPASCGGSKYPGIPEAELPLLADEIRALCAISVRGCFIQGNMGGLHGKELGRYFRNCYELAKRMTVILPCAMPYICVVGGAEAALYNLREHPGSLTEFQKAARIIAMQNATAFYAKLLLS